MRVMLVEEEIVAGIWHVSEELAKSNDPENNMKAVALVWCLEALGLDKPEENKRALSAGARNRTQDQNSQIHNNRRGNIIRKVSAYHNLHPCEFFLDQFVEVYL